MKTRLTVIVLASMLAACGFHLRGSEFSAEQLSVDSVYVRSHGNGNILGQEVINNLKDAGIKIAESPGDAQYQIVITGVSFANNVLSVSPQTGRVEEYQLTFRATATIRKAGKKKVLNSQTISVYRDYTATDRAVLGTFNEVQQLRRDLVRDAADQVLRIFRATLNKKR